MKASYSVALMERRILFLTIPLLDIALQRSNNPALKSRPVAIAVDGPRSRILNVSEEARKEGIGPGMVIRHARLLCPGLHVVPPNPRLVRLANHRLLELIHSFTPICENTATGAYFLDLTGTDRLLGCGRDVAAGKFTPSEWSRETFVTIHPSSIYRVPEENEREKEYRRFVGDMKLVQQKIAEQETEPFRSSRRKARG